ncbi:Protein kinase-like domain-containing protein [Cynara cardunculus var. scolymus]|uniref:Protein kinase-like domain-containing protein n=1 Tax=Cynara cardunculus var. scolymus TaxID=59895 RepID=A0A103XBP1_CYNCS|nr:Protein kinase-like domain-containing protein [Cynara cardunculus var. scolymus]
MAWLGCLIDTGSRERRHGSCQIFLAFHRHGGFGHVVLCKNKLDGRQYAVKKIRLKDKNPPLDDRILRYPI